MSIARDAHFDCDVTGSIPVRLAKSRDARVVIAVKVTCRPVAMPADSRDYPDERLSDYDRHA